MAETKAVKVEAEPNWYLRTEFLMTEISESGWTLTNQISKAVEGLNIRPARLERIDEAMLTALYRLQRSAKLAGRLPAVRIRIWSSAANEESSSWGFFLVERSGNESPSHGTQTTFFVDLFLYQEHGLENEGC